MKSNLSLFLLCFCFSAFSFAYDDTAKEQAKSDDIKWTPLLSSDTLDGWEVTNFGGEGEVEIKDGVLKMTMGDPLTGVTSTKKDLPTGNYEMRWQARRVTGHDFFVGITFPVGSEHCSFICGGWGGGLTGISSINGNDASENETTGYKDFKNNKWYAFKVRVDDTHVKVWVDDEQIINVEREGKRFSLRAEVLKSRPLGYCVFQSDCEIKAWEYRALK
ncbi:3-keto-disaccharide hydrolase [Pirellulaceae bacterium SH449]